MPAAYPMYDSVHRASALDVREASVLIVDDDSANVAFLIRLLEREGYTGVCGTTSARQALNALQNEALEERVRERTQDLEQAQVEILSRLALIAEYHDEGTAEHTRRVAALSGAIALELGLDKETASLISRASLLHDVGKVAVPGDIINEPGALSEEQWRIVRRHSVEGARILAGSGFEVLQQAEEIARTHHERWDGTGYPYGMAAEAIPIAGRIVAAADVCDALMSERPYKSGWPMASVLHELRRIRGAHLDPAVVDALERVLKRGHSECQRSFRGSPTRCRFATTRVGLAR